MQAELGGNKILPTDQVVEWLVGYTWMCPLHVYRIAVCRLLRMHALALHTPLHVRMFSWDPGWIVILLEKIWTDNAKAHWPNPPNKLAAVQLRTPLHVAKTHQWSSPRIVRTAVGEVISITQETGLSWKWMIALFFVLGCVALLLQSWGWFAWIQKLSTQQQLPTRMMSLPHLSVPYWGVGQCHQHVQVVAAWIEQTFEMASSIGRL